MIYCSCMRNKFSLPIALLGYVKNKILWTKNVFGLVGKWAALSCDKGVIWDTLMIYCSCMRNKFSLPIALVGYVKNKILLIFFSIKTKDQIFYVDLFIYHFVFAILEGSWNSGASPVGKVRMPLVAGGVEPVHWWLCRKYQQGLEVLHSDFCPGMIDIKDRMHMWC